MALSETIKTEIRRHLGFGPIGDQNSPLLQGGTFVGYRYFQIQGQLEFRIINLSPTEEIALAGDPLNPNSANVFPYYLDPDVDLIINGYVNICSMLESKIGAATDNLDTLKAGEWTWNPREIAQREGLYRLWCSKMARFLYVGMGFSQAPWIGSFGGSNLVN